MSLPVFVTVLLAIPLVFATLDLVDRHLTRHERYEGEGPRSSTLLFLVAVLLGYAALQYGGFALVPQPGAILRGLREAFVSWTEGPAEQEPIAGFWLVGLTALMFYLGGLWDYLLHRFVSHSRQLWWTHEYHHLPNQIFVLMPGVAARPFAVVSTFPVIAATVASGYLLLALLRLPLWDLAPLEILLVLQTFVLTSSHSSCLRRWWWVHGGLKWLAVTTPHEHVLHHTMDLQGNYGNFTTLWDRLFGTYLDPTLEANQGHALGLAYDQDFLGALTLGKFKLPERLRRRVQVGRYCNIGDIQNQRARIGSTPTRSVSEGPR